MIRRHFLLFARRHHWLRSQKGQGVRPPSPRIAPESAKSATGEIQIAPYCANLRRHLNIKGPEQRPERNISRWSYP